MSIIAAELIARVSAAGADATAASLAGVGNSADAARARFAGLAAMGAGVLVASLALVGAKASEMAGNYESAVTRLFTTAGESKAALGMIGSGVLDMSTQVGTSAQKLIQAMYFVESAGFHGQQGLNVLRIAAMGAKAENSDLTSVVKTLVSTLNAYTGTNLTAAGAMNTMIAAVSQGHMTLNDLAGAVSNVLPATARFHISLIDTTAAIAEMTKQGDNASSAATHLRQMILALEAPSKIGAASMKLVGLSSQQLGDEMKKSLPGAIQMVTDAVGKKFPEGSAAYNQAIKNIAGGSRQMMGFLELSGKHTKDFAEIVRIMSGDVKAGGNSIMGWDAVQGTFNFKMDAAKAATEKFMIVLGQKLLPVLGNIVTAVTPLIGKFTDFIGALNAGSPMLAVLGGILAGLAVVILAAVVPAVIAFGASLLAAEVMGAPLIAIVLGVMAVVALLILAFQHWGQISTWIGGVMSALGTKVHEIVGNIGGAFSALGSKVQGVLSGIGSFFSGLGSKIHEILGNIGSFVGGVFSKIGTDIHEKLTGAKNTTGNVFSAIGTTIHDKLTDAKNAVGTAFSGIGTMFTWLYNHNKYIKLLCDAIVLEFKMAIAWIQSAWTNTVSWLASKWNGLLGVAGAVFSAIGTFIHNVMTAIWGWIVSVWTTVTGWLSAQWNRLSALAGSVFSLIGSLIHDKMLQAASLIYNVWNAISSWISGKLNDIKNLVGNAFSILGTLMHDKMVQAWNSLVSFASGWPSQAFQWGVNLIQGLISGIGNMLGALGNMLGNVAGQIAGALGFHHGSLIPPKEGPAKDADQWMPALMHGLVWGIEQGTPGVHTALDKLMRPLATQARASLSLQATGSLGNLGGNLSTPNLSASYALRSASGGGQTIVINVAPPDVTLDGQRLTRAQMPYIVNSIRANAPARF